MDVRSVTPHAFPVLTPPQGTRKGTPATGDTAPASDAQSAASPRHPALTSEEQRYFESAFPASTQENAGTTTYSGGGAMRQTLRSGTLVDRKA
ncbi:hypothetical protein PLCT1_02150 [Planctomycetaceae bacterium]|nr:hypothetical protein PLCT1_02150 [Planctomycetaceae bacterium]